MSRRSRTPAVALAAGLACLLCTHRAAADPSPASEGAAGTSPTVVTLTVTAVEVRRDKLGALFAAAEVPELKRTSKDAARVAFLSGDQATRLVRVMKSQGIGKVLSRPQIRVLDGQEGQMQVGRQETFVTGVDIEWKDGKVLPMPKQRQVETRLRVSLTPQVSANREFVNLTITGEWTGVAEAPLSPVNTFVIPEVQGGYNGQPIPFTLYIQKVRTETSGIRTTVAASEDSTVLIGGLRKISPRQDESAAGPPNWHNLFGLLDSPRTAPPEKEILLLLSTRIGRGTAAEASPDDAPRSAGTGE